MSGILGGAAGNVAYGGTVNPPRNRKGGAGNPPPTGARASALPDNFSPNRLWQNRAVACTYALSVHNPTLMLASTRSVATRYSSIGEPSRYPSPQRPQSPATASLSQSFGTPSRSILNSDIRARSKPVTKAAPFVNGVASADRL